MADIFYILIWWFTIFIIGIIFLPLTFNTFKKFIDKGYIFSKVIGILLSSYLVWLFANLHLLGFTKITIFVVMVAFTLLNLWLIKTLNDKNSQKIPVFLIILEESLFLLALFFWSYVRAHEPSIRGLEKFMDFGFVNSILRSKFFPPLDMWLAKSPDYTGGFFINYYYFGHYVAAFLTKLTGIDSTITYNLMIATLFAFTFTLSFSIGTNLYYLYLNFTKEKIKAKAKITKKIRGVFHQTKSFSSIKTVTSIRKNSIFKTILAGLLAAFLVALGGNLHTIYTLTEGYPNEKPVPPWRLKLGFHPEHYWYPNATRFIPFTIHEFPIYSFVVADLHGHVSDIPFVLFTIGFLLTIATEKKPKKDLETQPKRSFFTDFKERTGVSFPKLILLGLTLAVMYMTNAWDGLIYLILSGLIILYINHINRKKQNKFSLKSLFPVFYKTFSACLFLFFFFLLASLPFSINFKPFVSGVGMLCSPSFLSGKTIGPLLFEVGKCQKSPLYMLALLWGFFYYNTLGFLFLAILPKIKIAFFPKTNKKHKSARSKDRIDTNIKKLPTFLLPPIRAIAELPPVDIFILIIIFISTLLLIFPEFFYIKDIYPAHYRANTMFKLGYQAFMMLSISCSYIFFRIKNEILEKKTSLSVVIYNFFFILLFAFVAIYPYFAINSYYNSLKNYRGLYGLNWLSKQYPNDYQAIKWLRENIKCGNKTTNCDNQPVIVEANGESYTDYARVSANSGLPTIIGWPVHEWLWRGSYNEAGKRIPEVANIYESKDIEKTKEILRKYHVKYIFLGALEKKKYKKLNKEKLDSLGKIVFASGETKIYQVNP